MNKIAKVVDSFVFSRVVVQGGELDQLSHYRDGAIDTHLPNVSEYLGIC